MQLPKPIRWTSAALGVAALALWARLTVAPQVFVGGWTLPYFPDVYYHLRRIQLTLESFPRVPAMDPLLNWPAGGPCPWPPGFDWLGALFVLALGGGDDPARDLRIVAALPVVLGLALLAVTAAIAWRLAPATGRGATALAAAGLAALLPQAIYPSQLGRVDHHVAEALSMLLLGGWALWPALARDAGAAGGDVGERGVGRWLAFEAVGAGLALAAGSVFNGSILYVAIACGMLIALGLSSPGAGGARLLGSGAPAMALAAAGLAGMNAGAVAAHGLAFDFRFPSYLQPLLHAIAALGCAAAVGAARLHGGIASTPRRIAARLGTLAGAALLLLVGLALAAPDAARELMAGLGEWLLRRDPWLAGIVEFQPLLPSWALWQPAVWRNVLESQGVFGLLSPLLIGAGVLRAWRLRPAAGACFGLWSLAVLVLTLIQIRFGRVLAPNLAIAGALALHWAASQLRTRAGDAGARLPGAGVLVAATVAGLALSDPLIRHALRWQPPRAPSAVEAASLFLGGLGAEEAERGVLARWDAGHTVLALSGRPVVAAGFGPWPGPSGFEEVAESLRGDEPGLVELMDRRQLGFLVAGTSSFLASAHVAEAGADPVFLVDPAADRATLNPRFLAERPLARLLLGGGAPNEALPHARHLLPRFASPDREGPRGLRVPEAWVFERVAGAALVGHTTPHAQVVASLELALPDTTLPWRARGRADASGRFRIVVPIPTGFQAPGLRTPARYVLTADGAPLGVAAVSLPMVRSGTSVEVEVKDEVEAAGRLAAGATP